MPWTCCLTVTWWCFRPPVVRVSDKVMIPQEEYPDINFVGLLIGPRGNTLKTLEKDVRTSQLQNKHKNSSYEKNNIHSTFVWRGFNTNPGVVLFRREQRSLSEAKAPWRKGRSGGRTVSRCLERTSRCTPTSPPTTRRTSRKPSRRCARAGSGHLWKEGNENLVFVAHSCSWGDKAWSGWQTRHVEMLRVWFLCWLQIWEVIRNDISQPDGQNELRKQQLMQLAQLNGTFRQPDALM